jgi:transposase
MEEITDYTRLQARSSSNTSFDLNISYKVVSANVASAAEYSEEISAFVSTTTEHKTFKRESVYEEVRECVCLITFSS